jgi:shikimate kinase
MLSAANIYLVGLMGAGKTTIGRHLAKSLGRRFVDSDHEIEARTGVRIPTIFEIEGEAGFRAREAQVLAELTQEAGLVVATGGGCILSPANRKCLASTGTVIYLFAPPEVLFARTRHDRNRPLLRVPDPLAKLKDLFVQRDPLYREVADMVFEAKDGVATTLAQTIESRLRSKCEP